MEYHMSASAVPMQNTKQEMRDALPQKSPLRNMTPNTKYTMAQRVLDRHAKVKNRSLVQGMDGLRLFDKENNRDTVAMQWQ